MNDMRKFIDAISEEQRVDELKPMGKIGKMATGAMAKMGNRKAKVSQVAQQASEGLWNEWEQAAIKANIKATVPNIMKWLKKRGSDEEVIQAGFKGIGVDASKYASPEGSEEATGETELPPEVGTIFKHTDGIKYKWAGQQWEKETEDGKWQSGVVKTATGNEAYIASVQGDDAAEEADEKMPEQGDTIETGGYSLEFDGKKWSGTDAGGRKIVPKDDMQPKVTDAWQKEQGGGAAVEPTGDKLSDKAEVAGLEDASQIPMKDVAAHIEQEKQASPEEVAQQMQAVGADADSDDPIGDKLEPLTKGVNDAIDAGEFGDVESEEETEGTMDTVQDEIGGNILKMAMQAASEIKTQEDVAKLTDLQKWGFAVLAARNNKFKIQ